jgi:hypothetical protein
MSTKQTRTRGEDYQAPVPVPRIARTRGRPSDYEPELIDEACRLIRLGMTDAEICQELDVSVPTYYRWRANFPEFRKATNEAKEAQDDRVVDSLIRVAHEGNVTAQIFWLKNRRPNEWRDRKETEIIVPDPGADTEQLDTRSAALAALALFTEAQYDPRATGVLLEATANAEENDDGEDQGRQDSRDGDSRVPAGAPDPSDDDWETGVDLDPGEL